MNINMICGFTISLLFLNNQILGMEEIGALPKQTPMAIKFSESEQKPQEQKEQEQKSEEQKLKETKNKFLNEYAEFQKKWEGVSLEEWAKIQQTFYPKNSNKWQILQKIIEKFNKKKNYYKKRYMDRIALLKKEPAEWAKKYLPHEKLGTAQYIALTDIIKEYETQPRQKLREEGVGVIPTPPSSPRSERKVQKQEIIAKKPREEKVITLVAINDNNQKIEINVLAAQQSRMIDGLITDLEFTYNTIPNKFHIKIPQVSIETLTVIVEILNLVAQEEESAIGDAINTFFQKADYSFNDLYHIINAINYFHITRDSTRDIVQHGVYRVFMNKTMAIRYRRSKSQTFIIDINKELYEEFKAKINNNRTITFDELYICLQNLDNKNFIYLFDSFKNELIVFCCKSFASKLTTLQDVKDILNKNYIWKPDQKYILDMIITNIIQRPEINQIFKNVSIIPIISFESALYLVAASDLKWDTSTIDDMAEFKDVPSVVKDLVKKKLSESKTWQQQFGQRLSDAQQRFMNLYNRYKKQIIGGSAAVGGLGALYWWKYGRGASNQ